MARNAYILLSVLMAVSFALAGAVASCRESANNIRLLREKSTEIKVFYLAGSGLEHAKNMIANDPAWSTDMIPATDDKTRLLGVLTGEIFLFGDGGYKMVREAGKTRVYSIGFIGGNIMKSRGYSFQRIDIELPLKTLKWEEF